LIVVLQVQAVVTDNAANITAAVRKAGLTHLFCFAHTLNLVVQNGVRVVKQVQDKVKAIVEHFHRSSVACEKLLALQRQMRPDHNAVKLKNDVVTRWNSTYDMLRRISEIQEPVEAAITVLGKPVDTLTTDEWLLIREAVTVLRPFEMVTTEISSETNVSVSKVIVLVRGLISACNKMKANLKTSLAQQMSSTICDELCRRFANCEMN